MISRVVVILGLLWLAALPPSLAATRADGRIPVHFLNPIQRENALPGTRSWRLSVLSYRDQIEGYPSVPSVPSRGSISFSVSTTAPTFTAVIYRMGWYRGNGGREMLSIPRLSGHRYPKPKPNKATGLILCRWPTAFTVKIPRSWVSGVYLVKLTASNAHQGYIPFVVTDPSSHSPLLFVHGLFTDEAYNDWGGKSLYGDSRYGPQKTFGHRAVKVSFLRPFVQNMGSGWFLSWEYHMVRFIERRGYDVTYLTDLDVHRNPRMLRNHRGLIIAGHDEYWSLPMRNGFAAAVTHGVNLANFAANTGYWQVRLEGKRDTILVCYKDVLRDPLSRHRPALATTTWRSPPVSRPESALLGAMYGYYEGSRGPFTWVVSDPHSWVFRGTRARRGSSIPGVVGQESDLVVDGYPHPRGLQILASSPIRDTSGSRGISNATLYTARSGAQVFNAGAIEWSWGVDDTSQTFWLYHPRSNRPSRLAERVTANVLNRFDQK